ncbi:DMT family transporter [Variovorax sp. HJSM1_2]|uniref:DMT family transporter n=1 Tax=Variovorax sp. HJSM1_2 TaxID=3366263 RepID=UPI003BD29DC4
MTTSTHCPPTFASAAPLAPWLQKFAGASLPLTFILLWSSGYVAGKLALPHVGPFTLLVLRFGLAALVLGLVSWLSRAPWPNTARAWGHLAVVGLLMQALHFSGVYYGMRLGVSAGVAGLLIGMMPLATALGGHFLLGERVGRWQMLGLAGGVLGVALVVASKGAGSGVSLLAVAVTLLGLLGLVAGTLYQKRFCAGMDLRSGAFVQMAVATLAAAALAGPAEGFTVHWHGELLFAMLWLGLVNSIGAFSLLFVMVRRGQAGQVASLFYLIPGVSALMGFALLGERLSLLAVAGFAVSAIAVLACVRKTA